MKVRLEKIRFVKFKFMKRSFLCILLFIFVFNTNLQCHLHDDKTKNILRRVRDVITLSSIKDIHSIIADFEKGSLSLKDAENKITNKIAEILDAVAEDRIEEVIKRLAEDFPIFTRGWLASTLSKLPQEKRKQILDAVNNLIEDTKKNMKIVRVIPVGPAGTRGFPFSTSGEFGSPKPFNLSPEGRSFVSYSLDRAELGIGKEDVYILTSQEILNRMIREAISNGLEASHVFAEPFGADTLAAVGLTVALLSKVYGEDAVISFMTTDHDIPDLNSLKNAFETVETIASIEPSISILGIDPHGEANTNMGYIERDESVDTMVEDVYGIKTFKEKPGLERAKEYVAQGDLWNSGKATAKISTWFKAFKEFAPDYFEKLQDIMEEIDAVMKEKGMSALEAIATPRVQEAIRQAYEYFGTHKAHYVNKLVEPVPERTLLLGLGVIPYRKGWSDLGSLGGRWVSEPKRPQTVVRAPIPENIDLQQVEDSNILLAPEDTTTHIHAYGLKSMIVAYNYKNKTLVVIPMSKDGNVKQIVNNLKQDEHLKKYVILNSPEVPPTVRPKMEVRHIDSNTVYLANGGDAFIMPEVIENGKAKVTPSKDSIIFARDGLVCVSDVSGIIIIKDGNDIYIYGPSYKERGEAKLKELIK